MTANGGILLVRAVACVLAAVTVSTATTTLSKPDASEGKDVDLPAELSIPVVTWTAEAVDVSRRVWVTSSLATDSGNTPHIAYCDLDNQTLMYATKKNGTWVSEVVDDTDLVGDSPSIAIDSLGRVHIAYGAMEPHLHPTGSRSGPDPMIVNPRYAVKTDGGWERYVIPHNVWGAFPSLAIDSLDRPHISYADWSHNGIYYATFDGSSWKIEVVDPEGVLESYLALDSKDIPHVLYTKWDNWSNVFYATQSGSSWESEYVGPGGYFVANLAIDTDDLDRPHAFWGGSRSGAKHAVLDGEWVVEDISTETSSVAMVIRGGKVNAIRSGSLTYYGVKDDSGWSWEIANSTKRFWASSWVCPCLSIDGWGQPHMSAVVPEAGVNHLYYFSRLPPTLTADAGPDRTASEGDVITFSGSYTGGSGGVAVPLGPNVKVTSYDRLDGMGGIGGQPKPVLNKSGTAFVTWTDGRTDLDIYFNKAQRHSAFENDRRVDDLPPGYWSSASDIALGTSDKIHIAWWAGDTLYSSSTDGGMTFSPHVMINDPLGGGFATAVATQEDGGVHVVWGNTKVFYRYSPDGGLNWDPCIVVGAGEYADVSVSPNGTAFVAWPGLVPGSSIPGVLFSRRTPGGAFGPVIPVHPLTDVAWKGPPSVAFGSHGEVLVTWYESDSTGQRIMLARSLDGGLSFESPLTVRTAVASSSVLLDDPSVASFGAEGVAVAWIESMPPFGATPEARVSVSVDGGATFGPFSRIDDDADRKGKRQVAIAGNANGDLFAAWHDCRLCPAPGIMGSTIYGAWLGVSGGPANATFAWDFDSSVDGDSDGDYTNDVDATGQSPTWTYGDNGVFAVTLTVTNEEGRIAKDTAMVTVLNVPPSVKANCTVGGGGAADIYLRIAGEKWHDVRAAFHEDGVEIGSASIVRMPGSPNDQMAHLGVVSLDGGKYSVNVTYTPEDDPINGQPNGATPAWIILRQDNRSDIRLHHTFNVRHPETWNWTVTNLEGYIDRMSLTCTATAIDPGSDDLTFTWEWGDGTPATTTTYYNDGTGPDPYPSPGGTFPFTATDSQVHVYAVTGTCELNLIVRDDDGGTADAVIILAIG